MKQLILLGSLVAAQAWATGVYDITGSGTLSFENGQLFGGMIGQGRTAAGDTLLFLFDHQPIALCGGSCFSAVSVPGNFVERTFSGGMFNLLVAGRISVFLSANDFNAGVVTALRDDGTPPPLDIALIRAIGVEGTRTFDSAGNWTAPLTITPVPEPATALPAVLACLALLLHRKRRADQSSPDGCLPADRV